MSIVKWIETNKNKHNDRESLVVGCVTDLGVQRDSVVKAIRDFGIKVPKKVRKSTKIKLKAGRCLNEFKNKYDKNTYIPEKIKAALESLGDAWEYENEFVSRANISYTDLNIFRDMFYDNFVLVKRENKKVWCGTKDLADKIKELI